MREVTHALAVTAIGLLAACGAPAPEGPSADPAALMEADRAFAAAVADGGSEAWAAGWNPRAGAKIVT